MMFVASAGNDSSNINRGGAYPAAFDLPSIVSVAATDHNDELASFSNYGAVNADLAAPGVNILSTLPNNSYGSKNGTSMAALHVAGVAALAWSHAPDASYLQVRNALLTGADPVASLSDKVFSGGRLNAAGTLARVNDLYVAPAAPTDVAAVVTPYTRTDGSVIDVISVTWQHAGDPELQRYDVYRSTEGGEFVYATTTPAGTTSYLQAGDAGTTYTYYVPASNFLFTSDPSATAEVTMPGEKLTAPQAPINAWLSPSRGRR